MNSEIIHILESALEADGTTDNFNDLPEINIINGRNDGQVEYIQDADNLRKLLNSEVDRFKKNLFNSFYEALNSKDK
ncbi:hypothetical protein JK154_02695 [Citrobacter sp. JGM124]|nr:hypothetical protein [Citrobacter sp. JGM124]